MLSTAAAAAAAAATSAGRRRIAVAMSGGVDSSVAAYLLLQGQNNDVMGLFMSNWDPADEDSQPAVCNEQDFKDARAVCDSLKIPLHHASFAAEYWTGVFEPFVDGIARGEMPNPDVGCNSIVKFGAMKEYAHRRLEVDWIATGHYARLWHRDDKTAAIPDSVQTELENCADLSKWLPSYGDTTPLLLAGADLDKDQSYFLSGVAGESFQHVLFPLGEWHKSNSSPTNSVRQLAQEAGLVTATKRESMGICFVGKRRKFGEFISQYLPIAEPGVFMNVDSGAIVGQHKGALHYSMGQGAKISGASTKWFVAGREGSTVFVCDGTHHPALYANELFIKQPHWIAGQIPTPLKENKATMRALCRTRHLQPLIPCEIFYSGDNVLTVRFDRPVRAITPGQMAAIYVGGNGLVCLGGGPIGDRGPSYHEQGLDLPQILHPAGQNDLSVEKRQNIATAG